MIEKPHTIFWRLPSETRWRSEEFTSESAARARIKTIETKSGWWVLKCGAEVKDKSTPKT